MSHLGSDGKPFNANENRRLERALVSLTDRLLDAQPEGLEVAAVRGWHRLLSADLPRMFPGEFRTSDITFGSFLETSPDRVEGEMRAMIHRHRDFLTQTPTSPESHLLHATWLHAELIRIHPFWDGNGRLARALQTWLCWTFKLSTPNYRDRPAYLAGLNRYYHTRDLSLLMDVTREAQKR